MIRPGSGLPVLNTVVPVAPARRSFQGILEVELQLIHGFHLEEGAALVDQGAEVDAAEVSRVTLLDGYGRIDIGFEIEDLLSTCVEGKISRAFVQSGPRPVRAGPRRMVQADGSVKETRPRHALFFPDHPATLRTRESPRLFESNAAPISFSSLTRGIL